MAHYVVGLLDQDTAGPEQAFRSYRKVLDLDPGFEHLATIVATEHLRRGDTAEALNVLKDALKASPKDATLCLSISAIYLRHLNKPELALKYAQDALRLAPKKFAPYQALYEIYTAQNQKTRAEQIIDRASKVTDADGQFYIDLMEHHVRTAFARGVDPDPDYLAELDTFANKALEASKEDPDLVLRIADFYAVTSRQSDGNAVPERMQKAAELYEKALVRHPRDYNAREKLAQCYQQLGRDDDAIAAFEELLEANSLNIRAYTALARLYEKKGNYDRMLSCLRQALILNPTQAERHMEIINLLFKLRRYEEALQALREARERFPALTQFAYLEAIVLSQMKRHEEALQAFERVMVQAANTQPELLDSNFYFDYGAAAEQAGRYEKAAELLRKSIELDPYNAHRAYNYLGYMWAERGVNLEEAEQLIQRALEMDPENGAYIDSIGWVYYQQGKYEEALAHLLRAAELLPEPDPVVFDHIGDAYDKLGRGTEAVIYWQKAAKLDPENREIAAKINRAVDTVAKKPEAKATRTPDSSVQE